MARQRVLPRPGSRRRTGRLRVRTGGRRAIRRCARRNSIRSASSVRPAPSRRGPWDSNYQIEDDYSWFIPGKHGRPRHEVRRSLQLHRAPARVAGELERHVHDQLGPAVRPGQPENLSRTVHDSHGNVQRVHQQPLVRDVRAGQVADEPADDAEPGDSLRPRDHPARRDRQPAVQEPRQEVAGRQEQLRAEDRLHALARRGRQVGDSRRLRDLLQPDDSRARSTTRWNSASSRRRTSSTSRPTAPIRVRAPDGSRPTRTWSTGRSSIARSSTRRILQACR